MKFDIGLIIRDMKEALTKGDVELLKQQLNLIYLYLDINGFEATEEIPLYLSIKNPTEEIFEAIRKYKVNKKVFQLDESTKFYYSEENHTILIEEELDGKYNWILLRLR